MRAPESLGLPGRAPPLPCDAAETQQGGERDQAQIKEACAAMTTAMMSGARGSIVFSQQPDAPRPAATDYIEFAVSDSSPRWAREFAIRFLRPAHGLPEDVTDTALVVVSELVTNAVDAARRLDRRSTVGLSLRLFPGYLLAEVVDSSPEAPFIVEEADVLSEDGRGLRLVDALTDGRWGWFRWASGGRKIVWCQVVI
jgi:anti-sigma regulatory factor (Ser/Thr protein kinase)